LLRIEEILQLCTTDFVAKGKGNCEIDYLRSKSLSPKPSLKRERVDNEI